MGISCVQSGRVSFLKLMATRNVTAVISGDLEELLESPERMIGDS